jgi:predicted nucleic acid-binding Zn ribbon protein
MSVYCANCGTENEDGAVFCGSCGAKMEQVMGSGKPDKKKNILKALGAVVLVVVVVFLLSHLFQGYRKPLNMFIKGLNNQDGEKVIEAAYRGTDAEDDVLDEVDTYEDYIMSFMTNVINNQLDEEDTVKLKDMKISYKVTEKEKYSNIEKWQEDHNYDFVSEDTLYDRKDVSKVYELRVKITVKYESRKTEGEKTFTIKNLYAVKYNGKWSLNYSDYKIA